MLCIDPSRKAGKFHEALNLNQLSLKLNQFICNLVVGSPHSLVGKVKHSM